MDTTPAGKNFPEFLNRLPMTNKRRAEIPETKQESRDIPSRKHDTIIICI
jgi:hypothetical protein